MKFLFYVYLMASLCCYNKIYIIYVLIYVKFFIIKCNLWFLDDIERRICVVRCYNACLIWFVIVLRTNMWILKYQRTRFFIGQGMTRWSVILRWYYLFRSFSNKTRSGSRILHEKFTNLTLKFDWDYCQTSLDVRFISNLSQASGFKC